MLVTITDRAKEQFLLILKERRAIKIGVETKGCSGKAYTMTYVMEKDPLDEEIVLSESASLYLDPKALLFMLGTEIDYESDEIKSGFVFRNPNEKGRCGCGKSFHV